MLVAKLGHGGHGGFITPVMPVTDSQIIPVRPLSQPPPPPVDASGGQPPPLPPMFPEQAETLGLAREQVLAFRPRWRVGLATITYKVTPAIQAMVGQLAAFGRWVAAACRSKTVALAPLLGRARLRVSLWWLVAVGWVVNQAGRVPKVQFARARREQADTDQDVPAIATGLEIRTPVPADLETLRCLERRLQTLVAQLDVQRIAGSDNTPSDAGSIAVPRAPFDVVEMGGRAVGVIERGF